jgi:hypothetical protein
MRLHRCVPVLATVLSLAGVSASGAQASEAMAPSGGIGQATPTVVEHPSGGSIDLLIGIGTAAGVVVVGTGAAATRRNRRLSVAGSTTSRAAS